MNIRSVGLATLISALFALPAVSHAEVITNEAAPSQLADSATNITQKQKGAENVEHTKKQHSKHADHQARSDQKDKMQCQKKKEGSDHADHDHKKKHKHKDKQQKKDKKRQHSYAHNIVMQAEVLGLTDEQLGKIVRLHLKEDREKHDKIQEEVNGSKAVFQKSGNDILIDNDAYQKLGQAHIDHFKRMIQFHLEERKAIQAILTPEQLEKLKNIEPAEEGHQHH